MSAPTAAPAAEPDYYRAWEAARQVPYERVLAGEVEVGAWHASVGRQWRERRPLCHRYAWAVPSNAALAFLVPFGPFVEIGAGTGYWAALLTARGADVVAYDIAVAGDNDHHGYCAVDDPFFPVRRGGVEPAGRHPDRTLFLCWPVLDEGVASGALAAYAGAGGRTLAYIGEDADGCTGDWAFHEALVREWAVLAEHAIPQWTGLHDRLTIYRRR